MDIYFISILYIIVTQVSFELLHRQNKQTEYVTTVPVQV